MTLNLRRLTEHYETAQWISEQILASHGKEVRFKYVKMLQKHLDELTDWLHQNTLGYIDQGSSRDTYRISSKLVIKLAWGDSVDFPMEEALKTSRLDEDFYHLIAKGIAQNKAEANSMVCGDREVITNVVKTDPKFFWIIQEYAEPIRSNEEFDQLTGIAFMKLQGLIRMSERDRAAEIRKDPHFSQNPWFMKLVKTMRGCGLSWVDLVALEHFGKIGNRVVLLDHGGTKKVMSTLYEYIRMLVKETLEEQIPVGAPTRPGLAGYMKKTPGAPTGTQPTVAAAQEPEKTVAGIRPKQPAQQVRPSGEGESTDELMSAIQSKLGSVQDPGKLRQILALLKN